VDFRILGSLDVVDHAGRSVEVRGNKLRTVLAMLVLHAGHPVSVDQLADALWGDDAPDGAGNALQAHMSKLRRLLEPGMLQAFDGAYELVVAPSAIDANEFIRLSALGREDLRAGRTADAVSTLRAALALWRGPALAELDTLVDAIAERTHLDEQRLLAAEDLVEAELIEGHHDAVVPELERLIAAHPMREQLWGHLMVALYRSGRQADALRAFQRARDVLAEELGLDPGPALREIERRVLDQDPTLGAPARTTARSSAPLTNIHPELTSFVGRVGDLDSLTGLVAERRLVTITGPGGVGKTRLAGEVALRLMPAWRDGAWIVELGSETGHGATARAFARALGDRLGASTFDSTGWIADGLGNAHLLIVLDNCEHVSAEVAPVVETLLRQCPGVHVLATSREPLGCAGELVRPLEPLPIADAAELFAARAGDASGDFRLDPDTAEDVDVICAHVECLPLAIELTAARARVFSTHELAEMLAERFGLASTDSATRPPRQRTMHAAVEWSYDLLFEGERHLLAALAVFSGGFTIDAVIAVCTDDDLPADDIELTLARLVDRSLVSVQTGTAGARRFRLLRPVAEFATRKLTDAGRHDDLRTRHLRWLVSSTAGLTSALRGRDGVAAAARVNAELGNIAHGVQWALGAGDPDDGLQLLVNLGWYAFLSANVLGDEAALVTLIDRVADPPADLRCRALMWAGILSIGNSDRRTWALDAMDVARLAGGAASPDRTRMAQPRGIALTLESIAAARDAGDARVLMEALAIGGLHLAAVGDAAPPVLAIADELQRVAATERNAWYGAVAMGLEGLGHYVAGDLTTSIERLTAGIDALRSCGDAGTAALFDISWSEVAELLGDLDGAASRMERAHALVAAVGFRSATILRSVLCWLTARTGDLERAVALGREAVAEAHRPFNPVIRAQALFALGVAEGLAGDLLSARTHLSEALTIHERVGMVREAAMDHRHLGYTANDLGEPSLAFEHHVAGLRGAVGVGLPWTVMLIARGLAECLIELDQAELACTMLGAADGLGLRHGYPLARDEARDLDAATARAIERIGDDAARSAMAAGHSLDVREILALVDG